MRDAIAGLPIAVMDAIHMLSDTPEHRRQGRSRLVALSAVMKTLWRPRLFTTLSTAAGFASLALAPIPPVQVFGLYVALGAVFARTATIVMVSAILWIAAIATLLLLGALVIDAALAVPPGPDAGAACDRPGRTLRANTKCGLPSP